MVNKDVVRLWVAALRSGEYKQGRGVLRSGDEFCCLGVLCDLAVKAGVIGPPTVELQRVAGEDKITYSYDSMRGLPPEAVTIWFFGRAADDTDDVWSVDAPTDHPAFVDWMSRRIGLTTLNDSVPDRNNEYNFGEFTFGMIADLIEREYLSEEETADA